MEEQAEQFLDERAGVGRAVEVPQHARVDAEVLPSLQGGGEPVEPEESGHEQAQSPRRTPLAEHYRAPAMSSRNSRS